LREDFGDVVGWLDAMAGKRLVMSSGLSATAITRSKRARSTFDKYCHTME
jgi:hypothetical protein